MKLDEYRQVLFIYNAIILSKDRILELKRYDMKTGEISRLSGEFVRTLYYDGTRVLFSDKNGIYELSPDDFSTNKLSDISAVQLCSNGSDIFYSKDNVIYRLGSDDPIYGCGVQPICNNG